METRRTKRGPIKPRTKADYERLLDRHILPTFGETPLRRITGDHVNAWYLSLNAHTPTERAHHTPIGGMVTEHTLTPCAYTNAKPRWEWFGCSCGATWTAPIDKPGKCPREKEPLK